MNETGHEWQSKVYGILSHPTKARVLMLPDRTRTLESVTWNLPLATLTRRLWFLHLGWVTEAMQATLGIPVTALRYVDLVTNEEKQTVTGMFVLESRAIDETPPLGGTWITSDKLQDLTLAVPQQREAIAAYFSEIESDRVPDQRPVWAQSGWYEQAENWIEEQIESMGFTLSAPIEQVRVWALSCVLRARTNQGDYYFKCGAELPLAANEAKLMTALGAQFPQVVPAPVRAQVESNWMLLPDFGSRLAWEAPNKIMAAAYQRLAEMQISLTEQLDEFLSIGCHDRRMNKLLSHIDLLMDNLTQIQGLDEADIHRLQMLAPKLKELCWELESLELPYSLVHGDFYAGNIAIQNDTPLIFDWAEGCIAHPFFDMLDLFEKEIKNPQTNLQDSYLKPWEKIASKEKLLAAWDLAKPLAALHTAASSYHIVNHLEVASRGQLAWAVPHWLRLLLRLVPDS